MIKRTRINPFLFFSLAGLSSCTTVQYAPSKVDQIYAQRTPPAQIELFRSSSPSKKFFEIGTATACCSVDANSMIELLREKASESGGDALMALDISAKGNASATVVRYQ